MNKYVNGRWLVKKKFKKNETEEKIQVREMKEKYWPYQCIIRVTR